MVHSKDPIVIDVDPEPMTYVVKVVFMRHHVKDLLRDFDLAAIVYRGMCKLFDVDGPTHVAVWLCTTDGTVDFELGHTWNRSYIRPDLKDRLHNVLFSYRLPDRYVATVLRTCEMRSTHHITFADLLRVHFDEPPEGMTCIKWVTTLLDFPKLSNAYPVTMHQLEAALYTIGGVREDG